MDFPCNVESIVWCSNPLYIRLNVRHALCTATKQPIELQGMQPPTNLFNLYHIVSIHKNYCTLSTTQIPIESNKWHELHDLIISSFEWCLFFFSFNCKMVMPLEWHFGNLCIDWKCDIHTKWETLTNCKLPINGRYNLTNQMRIINYLRSFWMNHLFGP